MGNPIVHFEVNGSDLKPLIEFYRELFGWKIDPMPEEMNYAGVDTQAGSGIGGGLGVSQDGASFVTFYIEVDDTDAALKRIEKAGGKTVVPTIEMPGIVTFAHFADPAGNRVGLVKADPSQEGAPSDGDGAEVGWFEVLGPDADALAAFYTDLFGWTTKRNQNGDFIYHEVDTASRGRGAPGGIGNAPDGKSHCTVYAGVEDVTKTLERAETLGGTIVMKETQMSPDTVVGQFADPQGNVFGLYRRAPR